VLLWHNAAAQSDQHHELAVARVAYHEVTLTGFTRARATLPLVAETGGKVLEVYADIGDTIDTSGVFARIDDTFIRLDLDSNRVQREQLRSRIDYDKREADRYRTLVDKGSASRSRLDELEQTLRDNRHRLDELAVQAQVLEERLARTQVSAPAGWRVTGRQVEPGQRVNEGEVLGEAADFSALLIPVALSPQQFAALQAQHDSLSIQLPDQALTVPARIARVNPGFDTQTRKISVDIALAEPLEDQRGGLRAILQLQLPSASGAVLLPTQAVEESYEEYWVTREDGERIRVVRLGNRAGPDGNLLQVSSPQIRPGDRFRLLHDD
jgi:RND family efflux transporter MFP subunit